MKILMFGWEFPPHNSGGLGTACFGITRALAKRGLEIIFVLPKTVAVDARYVRFLFADIPGVTVNVKTVDVLLSPYMSASQYEEERLRKEGGNYSRNLIGEVDRYRALARRIAQEEGADIVHAHDWLSFGAGIAASDETGAPFIAHVHATEFDRAGPNGGHPAIHAREHEGLFEADKVVTVSNFTKRMIMDKYAVSEEKIQVVHNGIDDDQIEGAEDDGVARAVENFKRQGYKIVLFVGRLTMQKGPDYFVRLAQNVLRYEPSARFIVAGSGDMEHQIIHEAAELGVGDKVLFAGFLRGKELSALYRHADVYVMPSVSEPFGLTPLEAILHDTPVLISKQSGVSEVLSHALKTDFWDIDEMTNKIVSVLRHAPLQKTLILHSKEEVKKLNWGKAAEEYAKVYEGANV